MTDISKPPATKPGRGTFWVAAISPLWFAWRGRYLELLLCWAGYTAINWQAILLAQGWVLSDALRLGALSLLFPLLFTGMPTPVMGDGVPLMWTLGLAAAQAGWAWIVAPRQPRLARPVRAAGLVAVFGVVVWCFFGLSVPGTKPRAYVATMRDDLQALSLAQEEHMADHRRYQGALDSLRVSFESGVTVEMVSADSAGWSARARNSGTSATCAIFVGAADPLIPGSVDGEPSCVRPPHRPAWSRPRLH